MRQYITTPPHTIRVAQIVPLSHVDGPGARTVVYLQGCPIDCPGCQSPQLHDPDAGTAWELDLLAFELLKTGRPITISGGEPLLQSAMVAYLVRKLKNQRRHVILYTGFVLEDVLDLGEEIFPGLWQILNLVDVLADGPYIRELDTDWTQWRGSPNQRPIDLHAMWDAEDWSEIKTLDWDTPTFTIPADGASVVGPLGAMDQVFPESTPNRMCGQVLDRGGQ